MQVRVRYAPSPTGLQHIGSVRTALFNYLFARSRGGKFILRLEDTDRTRYSEEYVKNLYDTFAWLGFHWDEGPDVGGPFGSYVQSERYDLYKKHAEELVAAGKAYYCFCDAERLEKLRSEQAGGTGGTGYDRHCRGIDPAEAARRVASGEKAVIRLKIPLEGVTRFHDELLGDIEWKNADVSPDPVLLKSDGFPTYHLANVVDDHYMEITHVLRAQEWIPSTPLHVIMYDAFGWKHPDYCHLPMVMGKDGHKLSKRHGSTSIDDFRRAGYLPQALLNYVGMLGESYEDGRDLYALEDLERLFRMEKLNKAPAVFDYQKLEWFNGQYIRMLPDAELAALVKPHAVEAGLFGAPGAEPTPEQGERLAASMPLIKERISFLKDAPAMLAYLFRRLPWPPVADFIPKKLDAARTRELLSSLLDLIPRLCTEPEADAEALIKTKAEETGAKLGDLMMPLRVAITASRVSPPLLGSLRILGPEEARARVDSALELLAGA